MFENKFRAETTMTDVETYYYYYYHYYHHHYCTVLISDGIYLKKLI